MSKEPSNIQNTYLGAKLLNLQSSLVLSAHFACPSLVHK